MTRAFAEPPVPPLLDEATARAHVDTLRRLGADHGISDLRFASAGRLVGHAEANHGMGDLADFQLAVEDALGRVVDVFADRVLTHPNLSPDLTAARAL